MSQCTSLLGRKDSVDTGSKLPIKIEMDNSYSSICTAVAPIDDPQPPDDGQPAIVQQLSSTLAQHQTQLDQQNTSIIGMLKDLHSLNDQVSKLKDSYNSIQALMAELPDHILRRFWNEFPVVKTETPNPKLKHASKGSKYPDDLNSSATISAPIENDSVLVKETAENISLAPIASILGHQTTSCDDNAPPLSAGKSFIPQISSIALHNVSPWTGVGQSNTAYPPDSTPIAPGHAAQPATALPPHVYPASWSYAQQSPVAPIGIQSYQVAYNRAWGHSQPFTHSAYFGYSQPHACAYYSTYPVPPTGHGHQSTTPVPAAESLQFKYPSVLSIPHATSAQTNTSSLKKHDATLNNNGGSTSCSESASTKRPPSAATTVEEEEQFNPKKRVRQQVPESNTHSADVGTSPTCSSSELEMDDRQEFVQQWGDKIKGLEIIWCQNESKWVPQYSFSDSSELSFQDVYDEYNTGLNGLISIRELDLHFGTLWRIPKQKNEYSRRRKLVRFINKLGTVYGVDQVCDDMSSLFRERNKNPSLRIFGDLLVYEGAEVVLDKDKFRIRFPTYQGILMTTPTSSAEDSTSSSNR